MSKNRSPQYPYFGLEEAVSRVELIYAAEQRAPFTREVGANHCGYSSYNGSAAKALSALKKFGLIEPAQGGFRLSNDAIKIVVLKDSELDGERREAITRAFERVELFGGLMDDFGDSVSEQNLVAQLQLRKFSAEGALKAARAYMATIDFVSDHGVKNNVSNSLGFDVPSSVQEVEESEPFENSFATKESDNSNIAEHVEPLSNMKRDVYNFLDNAQLIIQYPATLTQENYEELEDYVSLFMRKMKRLVASSSDS